jgi:6-phosphogluconolactonase
LAPCHLAVDATGRVLTAANYTSGSVASYPIEKNGSIGPLASLMTAAGSGPNKQRQKGPHAHETVFSADNKLLYVPDLGLDQIRVYKVDTQTGHLTAANPPYSAVGAGMGPRHMVFSPDSKYAYVMNELKPAVSVFTSDNATGASKEIQTVPSVEDNTKGEVSPAQILIDRAGKHVYASNRGPGTIAVFNVDSATGKLTRVQVAETGFTWPRGAEFDPTGKLLFVGDQKTDKFVTFSIDSGSGKLTLTGKSYQTPSPVSFVFIPVE